MRIYTSWGGGACKLLYVWFEGYFLEDLGRVGRDAEKMVINFKWHEFTSQGSSVKLTWTCSRMSNSPHSVTGPNINLGALFS
jgi:hypothetical protein